MHTPEINTLFLALDAHINEKSKCEGTFNGLACKIHKYTDKNKGSVLMFGFKDGDYKYLLTCSTDKITGSKHLDEPLPQDVLLDDEKFRAADKARNIELSENEVAKFLDEIATNFKPN